MKNKTSHYISEKYPSSLCMSQKIPLNHKQTKETLFTLVAHIIIDHETGVRHRLLSIPKIDDLGVLKSIISSIDGIFDSLSSPQVIVGEGKSNGTVENTHTMPFSPKITINSGEIIIPINEIISVSQLFGLKVQIVDESKMYNYKSLFISYGGLDESAAESLNIKLKSQGVKTWFFPDDAMPGQKLHRMMHEGINEHDYVLLICSKSSLSRPGVLNEIERVLEREAAEGGSEILIPITIDDHVFSDWAPNRSDIAGQIRSRVIKKFSQSAEEDDKTLGKILSVLSNKC